MVRSFIRIREREKERRDGGIIESNKICARRLIFLNYDWSAGHGHNLTCQRGYYVKVVQYFRGDPTLSLGLIDFYTIS